MPFSLQCSASTLHRVLCPSYPRTTCTLYSRRHSTTRPLSNQISDVVAQGISLKHRGQEHTIPRAKSEFRIVPTSLTTTLDNHRRANRDGTTIDGVPARKSPFVEQQGRRRENIERSAPSYPPSRRLSLPRTHIPAKNIEYGGEPWDLTADWRVLNGLPRGLQIPWICELERISDLQYNVPALQRLNDEIAACDRYLSPSADEEHAAHAVFDQIVETISPLLGSRKIHISLVGSRATGLHGPISDLDLNLSDTGTGELEQPANTLKKVYKMLRFSATMQNHTIHTDHFLYKAKTPIIQCLHIPSRLSFQIQQTRSSAESLELSKAFLAEYPTARSLFKVLKQLLHMRGLTTGSHDGLTSYPLLNMIIASLKLGTAARDATAVGAQLLEFLDLFSTIDFYSTAIIYHPLHTNAKSIPNIGISNDADLSYDPVTARPSLRTLERKHDEHEYCMSFQDPADLSNDLGRTAKLIKNVQATFLEARQQIDRALGVWERKRLHGLDMRKHGEPLLGWCLEGNYTSFEEARRSLRTYRHQV